MCVPTHSASLEFALVCRLRRGDLSKSRPCPELRAVDSSVSARGWWLVAKKTPWKHRAADAAGTACVGAGLPRGRRKLYVAQRALAAKKKRVKHSCEDTVTT